MNAKARIEEALRDIDLQIYMITCWARDLESAFASMLALDADTTAADEALRATYQSLSLHRHRRAMLQRDLDQKGAGPAGA